MRPSPLADPLPAQKRFFLFPSFAPLRSLPSTSHAIERRASRALRPSRLTDPLPAQKRFILRSSVMPLRPHSSTSPRVRSHAPSKVTAYVAFFAGNRKSREISSIFPCAFTPYAVRCDACVPHRDARHRRTRFQRRRNFHWDGSSPRYRDDGAFKRFCKDSTRVPETRNGGKNEKFCGRQAWDFRKREKSVAGEKKKRHSVCPLHI